MVIIKNGKLLVQYRTDHNYYFYVGGHLEWGETILEGCKYVRDFLFPERENEHSVEFFILGDINKFEELEHNLDPQHPKNDVWCTWLDMNNLPDNLFPHPLSLKLSEDYKNGFQKEGGVYRQNG